MVARIVEVGMEDEEESQMPDEGHSLLQTGDDTSSPFSMKDYLSTSAVVSSSPFVEKKHQLLKMAPGDIPFEPSPSPEVSTKPQMTSPSDHFGPVPLKRRLLADLRKYWRLLLIIATPIVLCPLPIVVTTKAGQCGYVIMIMIIYWVTEALPLAITAFIPLVLYPVFGVLDANTVSVQYMKDSNYVFFGGMMMALAVEESQLHRRIGLQVLLKIGAGPRMLMLGFMVSTCFLSMWISNTAATAMMVPLALAIVREMAATETRRHSCHENMAYADSSPKLTAAAENANSEANKSPSSKSIDKEKGKVQPLEEAIGHTSKQFQSLCKGLLLSICYAANIGGTSTLTGTASNLVLTGQLDSLYPSVNTGVTFASWLAFAAPQMVFILFFAWLWLQALFIGVRCRQTSNCDDQEITKNLLKHKLKELGAITFAEKSTLFLFILLVLLWLFREPGFIPGWDHFFLPEYITDGTVAMCIGCLLFIFPRDMPRLAMFSNRSKLQDCLDYGAESDRPYKALLTWDVMQKKFSWSIIFLLGGGFAMAHGVTASKLDKWIGSALLTLEGIPKYVFVTVCVVLVTFLTEFSSNVTVASIFIPIGKSMADEMHLNPLYIVIPITIACSFAFMLPVATPPNAIVFSSGVLRVVEMAVAGFVMNLICMFILLVNVHTYGAWIYSFDTFPKWAVHPTANTTTLPSTMYTISSA